MFQYHAYRLHGIPKSIIQDQDPRFTPGFWRHVLQLLGIKLRMYTDDQHSIDGQTERDNRAVEI